MSIGFRILQRLSSAVGKDNAGTPGFSIRAGTAISMRVLTIGNMHNMSGSKMSLLEKGYLNSFPQRVTQNPNV